MAPGEVVALVLPNAPIFQLGFFAAMQALAVPALLNPAYPAAALLPLLQTVTPHVVLRAPATHESVTRLAAELGIPEVICLDADIMTLPVSPGRLPERRRAAAEDKAALLFSGGTTGVPKVIEHTHRMLVAATRCSEYVWPTAADDVFLPIAPFTHIYGLLQGVLAPLSAGAETVIPDRFQPAEIVELMARHRVTFFGGGPPALYAALLAASNLAAADLSSLRVCPAGGAPFPVELMQRWRRATGCVIHEAYGMTETAPISGTNTLTGVRPGSVGKPVPCNEVQLVDIETGTIVLPPGERGEVRVRGPHMMAGYRNAPEETERTLREGFLHTGDIGHLDAGGFLFITGRRKAMVFVKGFNVFPREVEEVIHTHPKVAAAGEVGVPDLRTGGDKLVAFVTPRQDEILAVEEITAHCAACLAAYKCPAEVRIVAQLPMTSAQKLDRLRLARVARNEAVLED
ncbi:MAG: class I adenylate-forming enzyme family protein [Rhodopila sp.]